MARLPALTWPTRWTRLALLLVGGLAAACAGPATDEVPASPAAAQAVPFTVLLVRHAEKADASRDPALSDAGRARAEALARLLADVPLDGIHSTDYRRTRDTAAPLLARQAAAGPLQLYDPRDLPGLAAALVAAGGTHLVVGHSNTTPQLVAALGGEPGAPIAEDEYSRLYVLTRAAGTPVRTLLLRF